MGLHRDRHERLIGARDELDYLYYFSRGPSSIRGEGDLGRRETSESSAVRHASVRWMGEHVALGTDPFTPGEGGKFSG